MFRSAVSIVLATAIAMTPHSVNARSNTKILPEGTRIYLKLDQMVSGKRGEAEAGDLVRCSVWRDVSLQGVLLVKAGTAATCKVESVKHSNIAGIKGKLVIGALDTTTVDGQKLQLTGGYNKEGKSRMAMTISLGVIVFLPLIFITGSAAELPEGAVIDAYSGPDIPVVVQGEVASVPVINLGGVGVDYSAEAVLDDFMVPGAKPEVFKIKVVKDGAPPSKLFIDNVNGKSIQSIPLDIIDSNARDGVSTSMATVSIKTLSKQFQKGINRFEVSFIENGEKKSSEVILNIQM
ncbi:hypothetical protein [Arenimonas sp.]|uniref:hypothetical protein n=1 Tax=Arenimonas sp. TaxID=1872635 RepID=UPI003C70364C